MDLIVRNARLADGTDVVPGRPLMSIGIAEGRIVALALNLPTDGAPVYDAAGCLACPGLIETHFHLDRSRVIDRCAPQPRASYSPAKGVNQIKDTTTLDDMRYRAERMLQAAILHGTTRMRDR